MEYASERNAQGNTRRSLNLAQSWTIKFCNFDEKEARIFLEVIRRMSIIISLRNVDLCHLLRFHGPIWLTQTPTMSEFSLNESRVLENVFYNCYIIQCCFRFYNITIILYQNGDMIYNIITVLTTFNFPKYINMAVFF